MVENVGIDRRVVDAGPPQCGGRSTQLNEGTTRRRSSCRVYQQTGDLKTVVRHLVMGETRQGPGLEIELRAAIN